MIGSTTIILYYCTVLALPHRTTDRVRMVFFVLSTLDGLCIKPSCTQDSKGCATTQTSLTTPFLPEIVTLEPTAISADGRDRVAMQQPCVLGQKQVTLRVLLLLLLLYLLSQL